MKNNQHSLLNGSRRWWFLKGGISRLSHDVSCFIKANGLERLLSLFLGRDIFLGNLNIFCCSSFNFLPNISWQS
jgi:hypothetical protein